jgi:hypothetical protein
MFDYDGNGFTTIERRQLSARQLGENYWAHETWALRKLSAKTIERDINLKNLVNN